MEDLVRSLQAEITRLNSELAQTRAESKKYRLSRKQVTEDFNTMKVEHEKALKEREALEARLTAAPSDLQKELDKLKGEVRTRDHKAAFEKIATQAKVKPEALNDLWQLAGVKVETDVVDEDGLAHVISEAVQARPYLLSSEAPQTQQPAPRALSVGTGYGRGGEPRSFRVTEENLRDPAWMNLNQGRMSEALADGSLVMNGRG